MSDPLHSAAVSVAAGYLLEALGFEGAAGPLARCALVNGLSVSGRGLVILGPMLGSTACARVERQALRRRLDVAKLRAGGGDGAAISVTVDVLLATLSDGTWPVLNLAIWTCADGHVWLVPPAFGPAVEVTPDGLMPDLLPPYSTLDARTVGLARTARRLALLRLTAEGRK